MHDEWQITTAEPDSMLLSAQVLAGVRANSSCSQTQRALTLRTEGPEALLDLVFEDSLLKDRESQAAVREAYQDLSRWTKEGIRFSTLIDPEYPHRLREVHQAPAIVFWRGELRPDDHAVSIVGSRNATDEDLRLATVISQGLVTADLTVASGLARGIDSASHKAALAAHGRTVAVVGTGLHHTYPQENRELQQHIEESAGLIVSQFEPDMGPSRFTFPMRNITMSGYGAATIVVTASENSGTRHQAQAAVSHSRGLILMESVALATKWGAGYAERGLAKVARTADEAVVLASMIAAQSYERVPFN